MTSIADLKLRFSLRDALLAVGAKRLPDRDGTPIPCPFPERHRHGDANPSFSLYAAGTKAKCFGCGFSGDQFDLIREHFQLPTSAAAVAWVRERFAPVEPMARPKRQPPDLHTGTVAEVEMLSRLRGIGIEALQLASGASFLAFGRFAGHAAWAVTERSHRLVEWRRLDGKPWPAFGRLTERKSHCQGTGKAKPVGIDDLRDCRVVAWMEGAPDFLAFWQFALAEGKVGHVAPVAMLGAATPTVNRRPRR